MHRSAAEKFVIERNGLRSGPFLTCSTFWSTGRMTRVASQPVRTSTAATSPPVHRIAVVSMASPCTCCWC